jgi:hypothetical protein
MSLLLPILVSAVVVFLASWILHTILKYHNNDFKKVPNEDGVQDALRKFNIPVGEYMVPRCDNMKQMKEQAFIDKLNKGPVLMMTVMPATIHDRSPRDVVRRCVVSIFAGCVAGSASADGGSPQVSARGVASRATRCAMAKRRLVRADREALVGRPSTSHGLLTGRFRRDVAGDVSGRGPASAGGGEAL